MRLTPWWNVVLSGVGGAVLSGVVAAVTAWFVVALTAKGQRRHALEVETRQALAQLFAVSSEIRLLVTPERITAADSDDPAFASLAVRFTAAVVTAAAALHALGRVADAAELRAIVDHPDASGGIGRHFVGAAEQASVFAATRLAT